MLYVGKGYISCYIRVDKGFPLSKLLRHPLRYWQIVVSNSSGADLMLPVGKAPASYIMIDTNNKLNDCFVFYAAFNHFQLYNGVMLGKLLIHLF